MRAPILRLIVLGTVLFATSAFGDELSELRDRNAQLEATVQELTLQLAAALQDRKRLEAALSAAAVPAAVNAEDELQETEISAVSAPAVADAALPAAANAAGDEACDVEAALAGYERSGDANQALSAWLKADDHLSRCSAEQLAQIRKAVKWDLWGYQKEVLALIDKALETR